MIRHCVLFRWIEGATPSDVMALEVGLGGLPGIIPEIRRYLFGKDLGIAQGNWDFALAADFEDESAFATYVAHPAHQELIAKLIRPILGSRAAVQFQIDPTDGL